MRETVRLRKPEKEQSVIRQDEGLPVGLALGRPSSLFTCITPRAGPSIASLDSCQL